MTQCAGKIKFFAAVMYDVIGPEEVYFMTPAMNPITLKVYYKKCNNVKRDRCPYVSDRNFIYEPTISNNSNANTKYIFYNIGNSRKNLFYDTSGVPNNPGNLSQEMR